MAIFITDDEIIKLECELLIKKINFLIIKFKKEFNITDFNEIEIPTEYFCGTNIEFLTIYNDKLCKLYNFVISYNKISINNEDEFIIIFKDIFNIIINNINYNIKGFHNTINIIKSHKKLLNMQNIIEKTENKLEIMKNIFTFLQEDIIKDAKDNNIYCISEKNTKHIFCSNGCELCWIKLIKYELNRYDEDEDGYYYDNIHKRYKNHRLYYLNIVLNLVSGEPIIYKTNCLNNINQLAYYVSQHLSINIEKIIILKNKTIIYDNKCTTNKSYIIDFISNILDETHNFSIVIKNS
jgi:hypothetical protein